MQLDDADQSVQPDDAGRLVDRLPEDLASASMALARRFASNATLWCWHRMLSKGAGRPSSLTAPSPMC